MPHCIQYALVGPRNLLLFHTENMTDQEVREHFGDADHDFVDRYNRCPECQAWTGGLNKLRTNIDCPAIKKALQARTSNA